MSKDYSKFKEKYLDSLDVDNVTGEQMVERTNCLDCEEYDKEKYYCPKYCEVIRGALKEAVPISYIEETIVLAKENGAYWYAMYLEILLNDWAERKEE